jgi:hypothetical protein
LLRILQVIFFANGAAVAAFFSWLTNPQKGLWPFFSPESGAASRYPEVT